MIKNKNLRAYLEGSGKRDKKILFDRKRGVVFLYHLRTEIAVYLDKIGVLIITLGNTKFDTQQAHLLDLMKFHIGDLQDLLQDLQEVLREQE